MPPRRGGAAVIVAALSLLCFLLPTSAISAREFGSKNHPARHVHELPNRSLFRCFQVRQQQRRRRRLAASVSSPTGPPPKRDPVLILPGFVSGKASYLSLKEKLESQGYDCDIIDVNAIDWAPTFFGQSFEFYLERIEEGALSLLQRTGSRKLNIVGHSAGGWLARLWMGSPSLSYNGRRYHGAPLVSSLICLGTPHYSLEDYPFGRVKETIRGERLEEGGEDTPGYERAKGSSLWYTNLCYPGVHHQDVRYVSVCGRAIKGKEWRPGVKIEEFVAHSAYKANCGNGDVWGDGVTDLKSSLLEGSEHVVLPGCMHSPSSSSWYGSEPFFDAWAEFLL